MTDGTRFIDAVETWWGARTGRPVDLADNRRPLAEYRRSCSPAERAELDRADALAAAPAAGR